MSGKKYSASLEYEDETYISVLVERVKGGDGEEERVRHSQLLLHKEEERVTSFRLSQPVESTEMENVRYRDVEELFEFLKNHPDSRRDVSDLYQT